MISNETNRLLGTIPLTSVFNNFVLINSYKDYLLFYTKVFTIV